MKILYTLSVLTLLFSTPLVKAQVMDHVQEHPLAQAHTTPTIDTPPATIAPHPLKKWFAQENVQNSLLRLKNGALATATSYALFMAAQKYAPHLLPLKLNFNSLVGIPFVMGSFQNPQDSYTTATALTLGVAHAAANLLPVKVNVSILGSFVGLFAGRKMYEKWQSKKIT
jgi:hypothetical protein